MVPRLVFREGGGGGPGPRARAPRPRPRPRPRPLGPRAMCKTVGLQVNRGRGPAAGGRGLGWGGRVARVPRPPRFLGRQRASPAGPPGPCCPSLGGGGGVGGDPRPPSRPRPALGRDEGPSVSGAGAPPVVAVPSAGSARPRAAPQAHAIPGRGGGGGQPAATLVAPGGRGSRSAAAAVPPVVPLTPPMLCGDPRHCPGYTPPPKRTQGHCLAPGRPRGLWAYRHAPAGPGVRSLVPPQGGGGAPGQVPPLLPPPLAPGAPGRKPGLGVVQPPPRGSSPPFRAATMGSLRRAGKGSGRGGLRTLKNVLVLVIDVDNGRLRIGHGQVPRVVWRVSGVLRLLLFLSGSFRACHPGPGTHRLVAPLAGAVGGPFPGPVREAGVGRA